MQCLSHDVPDEEVLGAPLPELFNLSGLLPAPRHIPSPWNSSPTPVILATSTLCFTPLLMKWRIDCDSTKVVGDVEGALPLSECLAQYSSLMVRGKKSTAAT